MVYFVVNCICSHVSEIQTIAIVAHIDYNYLTTGVSRKSAQNVKVITEHQIGLGVEC